MRPTRGVIHSFAELRTALHTPVKLESYGFSNWQLKYGFTRFVAVLKVKGLATHSRLITQQSLISGSMEYFTCDKTRSARKIDVENFVLLVQLSVRVAITYRRSYDSLIPCKLLHICIGQPQLGGHRLCLPTNMDGLCPVSNTLPNIKF